MTASALRALRERFQQQRHEAIVAFRRHLRPEALLAALRRTTDRVLRETVRLYPLPADAALIAVGGYGRGELYPHSDVDVLFLLDRPPDNEDKARLEKLVACMWDLGFDLSHSVRSIADCQREAASDITIETSLLESRWLAGNKELLPALDAAMQQQRDPQRFFQDKRAEMAQRHAHHQDTAYALEPHCKEAPGGLRDLLVVLWIARAAGLGNTWRDIAATDLLTASEYRALRRAELAFKRLRIELHLLAGRRQDRVLFDLQPALAKTYGFEAIRTRRPSELLMQRYYWAARVVSQLNAILMQSLEERLFPNPKSAIKIIDADFHQIHGRLDIRRSDAFERNPTLLLRAFLTMQERSELTGLSAQLLRAMWHARKQIDPQFRRNPVNRYLFLQILQQPRGVVHALRRMTMLNILPSYLPEFRRIVGQMQHDLFHAYTVDQHILQVIRNIRRFTVPEYTHEYPLASQLMAGLDRHWLLYVAALYHDIAKGRGGDHSALGARDARRFCRNHGIDKADTELVVFLVLEHLSMSRFAQKRDLSDPAVIYEFAGIVRTRRRLDALYVLTVADIRGTSPKVWNTWKGKLLETLYSLSLAALSKLSQGDALPDRGTVLARRKETAGAELHDAGVHETEREAFWQQLDVAYFLRHETDEIVWHTGHLYDRVHCSSPVVRARPIGQGDGLQILVYTPDKTDLFASICRYFDRRNLGVQEARIHTTHHGWALDSFIVLLPAYGKDHPDPVALVEGELALALQDSLPADTLQTDRYRRRPISRRSKIFPVVPVVELQPDENSKSWRLSMTASDRPGLLYSLAQVFASHSINLVMAKIMTLGDRVENIFIIEGEVLGHPRTQLLFERSVLARLSEARPSDPAKL